MTTINSYISTPGEILVEEFLEPMGISQYRLAKAIHKPQSAISDIVHGRRSITTGMASFAGPWDHPGVLAQPGNDLPDQDLRLEQTAARSGLLLEIPIPTLSRFPSR